MSLVGGGRLGPGGVDYYDVVLRAGVTYRIYVRPNEYGVDFDLKIFDERGNMVSYDTDLTSDALCTITPIWTGPFRIAVICARGFSDYTVIVDP